jgi:hypothetical protein
VYCYSVYVLALDREEAAASQYRAAIERLGEMVDPKGQLRFESRGAG